MIHVVNFQCIEQIERAVQNMAQTLAKLPAEATHLRILLRGEPYGTDIPRGHKWRG